MRSSEKLSEVWRFSRILLSWLMSCGVGWWLEVNGLSRDALNRNRLYQKSVATSQIEPLSSWACVTALKLYIKTSAWWNMARCTDMHTHTHTHTSSCLLQGNYWLYQNVITVIVLSPRALARSQRKWLQVYFQGACRWPFSGLTLFVWTLKSWKPQKSRFCSCIEVLFCN